MGGVQGRVQLREDLKLWTNLVGNERLRMVQDEALKAGIDGLEAARLTIDTTPSSLSSKPKDNRNWTGAMRAALDVKVTQRGNSIEIRVGWLNRRKQYFLTQEYGGNAFGKSVTPMNALANAMLVMKVHMQNVGVK